MEKILFQGHGIGIILRDGKYYIRYDGGTFTIKMVENTVSFKEAEKAKKSERDAYEVILTAQGRERPIPAK